MREGSKTSELPGSNAGLDDAVAASPIDGGNVSGGGIDAIELLLILSRKKATILRLTLAAAVVAAMVSFLIPKMYTATSTILPPQQSQSALTAMLGQLSSVAGLNESDLGLKNPADLFIAMLKSRTIEDRLIDRFDLRRVFGVKRYDDARKKLESRSYIVAEREGLISVSVADRDAQRAAELANGYVEELHAMNSELAVSEAAQRRVFYQQKLDGERDQLALSELALKQVQEKSGLLQPDAQARAIIQSVADMRAQVALHEVQLQAMRTYATAGNPDLRRAEQELAGLRSELAKLERNTGETGNGNLEVPTRQLPQAELEYIRRARDLKYHETLYDFLGKQLEAARLDEAKDAVVVQVVDKAVPPEKKSSPHRTLIVLVTAMAVFIVACVGVLLAEVIRRKEQDPLERARLTMLRHSLTFSSRNS
jgi:tyrosine-protein kinase Etk/Wzc